VTSSAPGVYADILDFDHVPVKELRSGGEDGFLVVGPNGVTFLKDKKTIVLTLPLSALESYAADAGKEDIFVCLLKQKASKKGDVLAHSFSTPSGDHVRRFVGTIDRYLFGSDALMNDLFH
jgi:hypothetical protein